eukprot:13524293-Alexandrium_andersonii.AAC.1
MHCGRSWSAFGIAGSPKSMSHVLGMGLSVSMKMRCRCSSESLLRCSALVAGAEAAFDCAPGTCSLARVASS